MADYQHVSNEDSCRSKQEEAIKGERDNGDIKKERAQVCSDVGSLNPFFVLSVIFKCSSNVQISLSKTYLERLESGFRMVETAAYLPVALQLTGLYEHAPPKCSL